MVKRQSDDEMVTVSGKSYCSKPPKGLLSFDTSCVRYFLSMVP